MALSYKKSTYVPPSHDHGTCTLLVATRLALQSVSSILSPRDMARTYGSLSSQLLPSDASTLRFQGPRLEHLIGALTLSHADRSSSGGVDARKLLRLSEVPRRVSSRLRRRCELWARSTASRLRRDIASCEFSSCKHCEAQST